MTLPYDVARCVGVKDRPECQNCRRKEPGRPEWQTFISPPMKFLVNLESCEHQIRREE
jgi:hypothetical protein